MSRVKTLVILTPAFPASESETHWIPFLQLMVKALQRNFPDLKIVVLSFVYPYRESTYTWHGVDVISYNGSKKRKLRRLLLWRKIWKKLKDIQRTNDVIGLFSIWCGECAFIGNYFGKWNSVKHIAWICGQDALETNKWVRLIRPKPEQLGAMSPFLVNEFEKNHGIRPGHLVPNAIDPLMFTDNTSSNRDIDILGAGSLVALKQYDHLVEVVAIIKKSIPELKAFHCGDGDKKEEIEAMIDKLGVKDNMILSGNSRHEDVLRLMKRTRVFLHPSRFEGFGGVCLEALYAGAHVISYIYPLDHPVAHWHVVKDKLEMAEKALQLLQDPDTDHSSVLVYKIDDSARTVMSLFSGRPQNQV